MFFLEMFSDHGMCVPYTLKEVVARVTDIKKKKDINNLHRRNHMLIS